MTFTGRDGQGNLTWEWDDRGPSRAVPGHGKPLLYAVDGGGARQHRYVGPDDARVYEDDEAVAA